MVLEVYLDPCTVNSRKVLAGLDLMEAKYNLHHIDYFKGEHKSPKFLEINPMGTVPAATDGDLVCTESNAILQYAAEHSPKGEQLYPKDAKLRAAVNRWLLWEASVWFQSCYIYLVEYVVKPLLKAEPDQAVIDKEAPNMNKLAGILNDQLGRTKYVAGNNITIADIAIASPMHLAEDSRIPLEKYPNLARWYKDIQSLPAWQKTQPAVDKALLPHKASKTHGTNGEHRSGSVPDSVRSTLNYTKQLPDAPPEIYFYEDSKGKYKNVHEPGDDPHEVTLHNGWGLAEKFHHDIHGFSLQSFSPAYSGAWEDEESVRSKFYPEVVNFLEKTTGASRVLVFDHTIRTRKNIAKKLTQETNTSQRAPVPLVHCDYTAESGPTRVKQLLPDEADKLLSKRVAFLNVWKPLAPVKEMPLAMCDVTSSPPEDFFKLFLRYRDRTGENYVMKYNEQHKWWYFPDMTAEQVIILKTFDNDQGKAKFVGHSAFEDPTSAKDAPFRESIEIRTIAFFD